MAMIRMPDVAVKAKAILDDPKPFYLGVAHDKGFGAALRYMAMLSMPYALSFAVYVHFMLGPLMASLGSTPGMYGLLTALPFIIGVMFYVLMLICPFVGAGVVHAFLRPLGAKGGYVQTYNAVAYSSTPTLVFGWIFVLLMIPFGPVFLYLLLILSLFGFYIEIVGLSELHNVGKARAAAGLLMSLLVAVLVAYLAGSALSSLFVFSEPELGPMTLPLAET
jgi:hypothetical protein